MAPAVELLSIMMLFAVGAFGSSVGLHEERASAGDESILLGSRTVGQKPWPTGPWPSWRPRPCPSAVSPPLGPQPPVYPGRPYPDGFPTPSLSPMPTPTWPKGPWPKGPWPSWKPHPPASSPKPLSGGAPQVLAGPVQWLWQVALGTVHRLAVGAVQGDKYPDMGFKRLRDRAKQQQPVAQ
ncbi:hypothetical protein V8C86DRAFT_1489600 [Haematococcus lacustris]